MIVHERVTRAGAAVVIGIPTYRRPADLARLLAALPASIAAATASGRCDDVEVLVIDNDEEASARPVAQDAALAVRYVVEPARGVAAVRNRALDEAAPSETLVFIDDDETPEDSDWLARMLAARTAFDAHVVAGPVRTVADEPLDPWIVAGGFFARAHRAALPTGASISRAATNNLLLDLRFVAAHGLRFDERFGRSGGEDSLFTSQLHRRGATMIWCAEAAVLDHLPPERRTRAHALQRTRGMASAGARVALALAETPAARHRVRARALLSGGARLVAGAARRVAGVLLRSPRQDAVGRREQARGIGAIEGACGRALALYGGGGNGPIADPRAGDR